MLDFYHRLARRLHGYRVWLWLISGSAVAVFAATLVLSDGSADEAYIQALIAVLMWSLCLTMVAYGFSAPLPLVDSGAGLWSRLKLRVKRGVLWLMAILTTVLSALVAFMSFRLVGILIRSL